MIFCVCLLLHLLYCRCTRRPCLQMRDSSPGFRAANRSWCWCRLSWRKSHRWLSLTGIHPPHKVVQTISKSNNTDENDQIAEEWSLPCLCKESLAVCIGGKMLCILQCSVRCNQQGAIASSFITSLWLQSPFSTHHHGWTCQWCQET